MSNNNISKPWSNYEPREKIKYLMDTSHKGDCTFVVGKPESSDVKIFYSYKWILSSISEVFETMFNSDYKESMPLYKIVLPDVEPSVFEKFLDFIYTFNVENFLVYSLETLIGLHYLGGKYMIMELKLACNQIIEDKLETCDVNNSIIVFNYFLNIENDDNVNFESKIKKIAPQINNSTCINNLDPYTFYELLKLMKGHVKEEERFKLIDMYATINNLFQVEEVVTDPAKEQNLANNVKKNVPSKEVLIMLQSINYSDMTPEGFCNGPGTSTLLDISKKYEILSQLCNKKKIQNSNLEMLQEANNPVYKNSCNRKEIVNTKVMAGKEISSSKYYQQFR